ncbi:phage Gp37/Gp68 family protein [Paraburkholderia xenovorans]|uniref:phage Gp37/Gp68 family protein n=1 Tax=Paraburkholderia xenovorans TaxID=36873 RepID=UPI0038BD56BA
MSENSKIEWTDHTFNPWEGCQKVGPGCDQCYAEARNARFAGGTAINWGPGAPRRRTSAANWRKPLAWNATHAEFFSVHGRRQRVFCASLADVFDNAVDPVWRADLFRLIRSTPNLDWLLLTKRIGNARQMIDDARDADAIGPVWPWENVWLGATIVNQEEADRDIPKLMQVPARVRFLSMEPLLGPVDLKLMHYEDSEDRDAQGRIIANTRRRCLHWVIVGGESGPGARPMHPHWPRSLRDQCEHAGVPFLYKQWGEWTDEDWGERAGYKDTAGVLPSGELLLMSQGYSPPFDDAKRLEAAGNVRLDGRMLMDRVGKKLAGRMLDGRTHDEFPRGAK